MGKKIKIQIAKEFRKNPTRSEKIMWNAIRNRQFLGLKFRRQHLVNGYIIDFYCHELKLAVEIDGSVHLNKNQIDKDIKRQNRIEKNGIRFFRATSNNVEYDIEGILNSLKIFLNKLIN